MKTKIRIFLVIGFFMFFSASLIYAGDKTPEQIVKEAKTPIKEANSPCIIQSLDALGILVGAFVTWVVAWYYYKRAGDELRKEASELRKEASEVRRLIDMILTALEKKGDVKLSRDKSGKILGFVFEYIGKMEIHFEPSSKTEYVPPPE